MLSLPVRFNTQKKIPPEPCRIHWNRIFKIGSNHWCLPKTAGGYFCGNAAFHKIARRFYFITWSTPSIRPRILAAACRSLAARPPAAAILASSATES